MAMNDERLWLSNDEMTVLHTATVCRKAGAARWLYTAEVDALIEAGLLTPKPGRESKEAIITEKGLASFVKGYIVEEVTES